MSNSLLNLISNLKLQNLYPENLSEIQDLPIVDFTTNSKKYDNNYIFVARQGLNNHGLDFINQIIENFEFITIIADIDLRPQDMALLQNLDDKQVSIFKTLNIDTTIEQLCQVIYPNKPKYRIAVTGTNGKTSTTHMIKQIWDNLKLPGTIMGTNGIMVNDQFLPSNLTTAPIDYISKIMHGSVNDHNCQHFAIEASSHGICQQRIKPVVPNIIAFTNLTQDHLDFHGDMEAYFQAKAQLFNGYTELEQPCSAIINIDSDYGLRLVKIAQENNLKVITYGHNPESDLHLVECQNLNNGSQKVICKFADKEYSFIMDTVTKFQALNALCAIAIVTQSCPDLSFMDIINKADHIGKVSGRVEKVYNYQYNDKNINIFIDYAHTPDALANVLQNFQEDAYLYCIFGCGGDRDTGKRPLMGNIANRYADYICVTDDNPRTEDPKQIIADICQDLPRNDHVFVINNRYSATKEMIKHAIDSNKNANIIIAGKGHENYQIYPDQTIPMSDKFNVQNIMYNYCENQLWNSEDLQNALNISNPDIEPINNIHFSSQDVTVNDLFIAMSGATSDGHNYIKDAIANGASTIICNEKYSGYTGHSTLKSNDTKQSLFDLAKYRRQQLQQNKIPVVAITGSVGKTSVKDYTFSLADNIYNAHKSMKSFNNDVGLPLSLARCPKDAEICILEAGMNHLQELDLLSSIAQPDIAVITAVNATHIGNFNNIDEIGEAKSEILHSLQDNGTALLPSDSEYFQHFLTKLSGNQTYKTFGEKDSDDYQLINYDNQNQLAQVKISDHGTYTLNLSISGKYNAMNILISLAILDLSGLFKSDLVDCVSNINQTQGRGNLSKIEYNNQTFTMIDDSYNANPTSMKQALINLKNNYCGKNVIFISEMMELGDDTVKYHQELSKVILDCQPQTVVLLAKDKNNMSELYHDLVSELGTKKCLMYDDVNALLSNLSYIGINDNVLFIKGSNSSNAHRIANFFYNFKTKLT